MRCLVLILLLGAALGQEGARENPAADPSLLEPRAWKGVIEARGRNVGKEITGGQEVQEERIEFLLLSQPPRTSVGRPRVPLRMREGQGTYAIDVDVREGHDAGAITSRGGAKGDLFPRVEGFVEPTAGQYGFAVAITPSPLAVLGTVSTIVDGRFVVHRTAGRRAPFLDGFEVEGELSDEGRLIEGHRTVTDRRGGVTREAELTWRIERLDAAVRGRVRDHRGQPITGMIVLARFQNGERIRQRLPPILAEGRTDADGRFRIPGFHGPWTVELKAEERDGVVLAGRQVDGLVQVRFDDVPELDLTVAAYRLEALPYAHLLRRHFQGDAGAFLAYVRERVPGPLLDRALVGAEPPDPD
jgi:hypothetical protein